MKRIRILISILAIFFQIQIIQAQDLSSADKLNSICSFNEEKSLLNKLLEQGTIDKTEIYWRLSRATYRIGEAGKAKGEDNNKLLDISKEGEMFADKALVLDPRNSEAFYWKASNLGLWTQLKGPIEGMMNVNSLRDLVLQTLSINPEHLNSYFYLGQLLTEVPGWPIGYGNIDFAISLARKGIWLYEKKFPVTEPASKIYTYHVKLARSLIKRNWSATDRQNRQNEKKTKYESSSDNFTKSCFFEGTLQLEKTLSDKDEARKILIAVQEEMKKQSAVNSLQEMDLNEAKELLKQL
jgi:hypothetical protein